MIFPDLKGKRFGYVNLNLEAEAWLKHNESRSASNPLLDPSICQSMIDSVHEKYCLDFSFGGWMEDRSTLWKGSYLERENSFIHLGIDINVPPGTEIAASFDATVAKVDDDYPEQGGWGPRVILKHATKPIYLIHAHLDRDIRCEVGDALKRGQIFARVGTPPHNGNWFPHLHLQTISKDHYDRLEKERSWADLDGYGPADDIRENASLFADPMELISLNDL
ncbi:MAG: peptidoglycan DD-metalloendopeptidase family protein [Patescibacteria group bacterium]|nr:peptidoglycan DD-metalloendopeptidase family protein [Patescibacteria group bacterium]MDE2116261.1 peptidoglycan DD-metalloendopeptidase family protein [Patescibacteria group bacterium]